jgi:hypothetical protein
MVLAGVKRLLRQVDLLNLLLLTTRLYPYVELGALGV